MQLKHVKFAAFASPPRWKDFDDERQCDVDFAAGFAAAAAAAAETVAAVGWASLFTSLAVSK